MTKPSPDDKLSRLMHAASAWVLPQALPLLLVVFATGFLGFDLGRYSDDWAYSLRAHGGAGIDWSLLPTSRWPFFFRPLWMIVYTTLTTIFWSNDRWLHVIMTLSHLGVGVMAFALLRTLRIAKVPAILGVMCALLCPLSMEAVLWPAAIGLELGMILAFACALICVRWVRSEHVTARKALPGLLVIALLAFCSACFHEQPASVTPTFALLALALHRPGHRLLPGIWRSIALGFSTALGCLAYAALLVATAPAHRRGSVASLVSFIDLATHAERFVDLVGDWLWGDRGQDVLVGSFMRGMHTLSASGLLALNLWAFLIVIAAAIIIRQAARGGANDHVPQLPQLPHAPGPSVASAFNPRVLALLGLGLSIALVSFLPIALIKNTFVFSRYFYVSSWGIALVMAAIGHGLGKRLEAKTSAKFRWIIPVSKGLATAIIIGLCTLFAICGIGWQSAWQAASRRDQRTAEDLRALSSRIGPSGVIIPVRIDAAPALTGHMWFDQGILGAMQHPWACWAFVQRSLDHADVSATHLRRGTRPTISFESGGVRSSRALVDCRGVADPARTFIPWDKALFITIDETGKIDVVSPAQAREELDRSQQ